MSNEFLDYVEDILDAMHKAEILLQGVTYERFETDFRTDFAVVRALEIIGEATKRLPMALRERYPDIPGQPWPVCVTASSMAATPWIWRSSGLLSRQTFRSSDRRFWLISRRQATGGVRGDRLLPPRSGCWP